MRVVLETPLGISSIHPRTVEAGDVFIGEPLTADGHTDIRVRFSNGVVQRYTAASYKIAKKDGKFYPCVIPFSAAPTAAAGRKRSTPRRTKSTRTTRRIA